MVKPRPPNIRAQFDVRTFYAKHECVVDQSQPRTLNLKNFQSF